ncbi:MAG: sugar ABC transporter permease [Clostridiales bacterium]|nr:sugar ABC transporter permease [Clostridiales bacterium]MDY5515097.1 sugar ABC transporter permease [Candidatus Ventricola sp.]
MKKRKQSADQELLDRSFKARIEPYLYLLPFFLGIAVFTLYPVINVVLISFKEGYSYLTRGFDAWGLANYQKVLSDPKFAQAISNTIKYVLLVVPISTCISVVVAYLLSQKLRFSALFQTAYFLPMVTSITAVGLAWKLMYNKNFGIINYILSFFGIDKIPWLENAAWSIPALVIFGIWNILPFTIILLLSGLQNIDPQYYTAARVDGSGSLRIFFRITVPLLAPTIFLVCIINTISCFKVFSELYPLFNGNPGPFYNLYTVVYYIRYAMIDNRKYGVAAAAAIVLFGFIFVFTMVQRVVQSWVNARKG